MATIIIGALILAGAIIAVSNIFSRNKKEGCGSGSCSGCSSCAACTLEEKEIMADAETDRKKTKEKV